MEWKSFKIWREVWHTGTEQGMCRTVWGLNMGDERSESLGLLLMDHINRDKVNEEIRTDSRQILR